MTVGRWRSLSIVFLAGLLGLTAAGCLGGASSPSSLSPAKPADRGSSSGFDHHSKRLEVRPQDTSMPVGKQLLMIATVYDENDKPRHHRRIEWTVEGAGNIVEVDESGILTSRGKKVDSKYAVTTTDFFDHDLPKGVDNPLGQVIRPGQTWCVISSAIEGETVVTAYAPDIADPELNRVFIKAHWVDARWQFPQPAAAKAGTDFTFATKVDRRSSSEPVANYRVRYTILDEEPATAVYPVAGQRAGMPRSVTVDTDADGVARANVVELKPDFGSNRIGIEVLKLDSTEPGRFVVVAKSETKIDWQAPQVKLNIDAPSTAPLNRAFPITYSVISSGSLETLPMMLKTV